MKHLLDLPMQVLARAKHHNITYQLDLGSDHWLRFFTWSPDLDLPANRERWGAHEQTILAHPVAGATVIHRCQTETGYHEGGINFRTPATALWEPPQNEHVWDVESWEPLTLSPSLLAHCPCNDHGYIKQGKWVKC